MTYYNTTRLTGSSLAEALSAAVNQNHAVFEIFRAENRPLSPSQVHAIGVKLGMAWLPTSVRRSMTNLADPKCGALVHLHTHRMGPHGRLESLWDLPREQTA